MDKLAVPSSGPIPLQHPPFGRIGSENGLAVPSSGPIPLQPRRDDLRERPTGALQYPLAGLFLYNSISSEEQRQAKGTCSTL